MHVTETRDVCLINFSSIYSMFYINSIMSLVAMREKSEMSSSLDKKIRVQSS